jgi:HD-GYP domain-containing protein (c-di-GMP phosphodiesterase class II)
VLQPTEVKGASGKTQAWSGAVSGRAPQPHEIAIGRPLPWPIHDRGGKLLLKRGEIIRSEGILAAVLERGLVYERDLAGAAARVREIAPEEHVERTAPSVFSQLRRLQGRVENMLLGLRQPTSETALAECVQLSREVGEACAADLDAALAAFQVDASEDAGGTAALALHDTVLCAMLAEAMGLEQPAREHLLCAALTHDVGMFPLADALVRQKPALSAEQRDALSEHTRVSCALLQRSGVEEEEWLRGVAEHHERVDGSGYPRGLRGDAICLPARILALVDTYSAMIRPRAYRDALPCREALRELFLERGRQIDEPLAALFIREIGLYPPGTLVRLRNGEVAIVTQRGTPSRPAQVKPVISASGVPLVRPAAHAADQPDYRILGGESIARYRSVLGRVHDLWDQASRGPKIG